ncbi:hypothetical protein ISN45_Aa04g009820 [Arabidopsis thaliana x Arabidopsis arenosa]|uniref:No apical meristem-associated C-terminal domain-containing protein n=1 Tax=Arabidopsis thaliana x Arabidopsis arenosa TaxID=1240361 RepID=A0A8T2A3M0_9BRAS|nr:hypothetical protein ISN45_Aa04g009820 [Arabidopsis thaliana x Arabidopsis arenosa]
MNELVMKFAGCYEYASWTPHSGKTEDDILVLAYKLYHQDHKTKFSLEHVWRILKTDQKWCNWCETKIKPVKKKAKLSKVEEESVQRPIGVKAAKALAKSKGKGKSQVSVAGSVAEFYGLWKVKEKDFTVKERLSKQKLFDSILGRSDGLSDMKISLKNTLIKEYLFGSNEFVFENEYSGTPLKSSGVGKEEKERNLVLCCFNIKKLGLILFDSDSTVKLVAGLNSRRFRHYLSVSASFYLRSTPPPFNLPTSLSDLRSPSLSSICDERKLSFSSNGGQLQSSPPLFFFSARRFCSETTWILLETNDEALG